MRRRAVNLLVVLHQHAVLQNRNARIRDAFAGFVEFRRGEENIVRLPVAGRNASVDERRRLTVNRTAGTVRVVVDFVRVENLDFVGALENDAVVPLVAPVAFEVRRALPFEVKLERAELFFRRETAGNAFDGAVDELPLRRLPSVEVRSVEEDFSVGRSGREVGRRVEVETLRERAFRVVNAVFAPPLLRRIVITVRFVFVFRNVKVVRENGSGGAEENAAERERRNGFRESVEQRHR